jgi:hypothetical protein
MKQLICIGILVCIGISCEKEKYSDIPYAPVRLTLYAEDMMKLISPSSHLSFTQSNHADDQLGYGGILVVHGLDYGASYTYYVYDLACPVEAQRNIRIGPDRSGITATCSHCHSVFNIVDGGYPESGTKLRLTQYKINPTGNGSYRVSH